MTPTLAPLAPTEELSAGWTPPGQDVFTQRGRLGSDDWCETFGDVETVSVGFDRLMFPTQREPVKGRSRMSAAEKAAADEADAAFAEVTAAWHRARSAKIAEADAAIGARIREVFGLCPAQFDFITHDQSTRSVRIATLRPVNGFNRRTMAFDRHTSTIIDC